MRGRRSSTLSLWFLLFALPYCAVAQNHALPPPVGGISFTEVIRLSQAGLSDNTIIAQIKMRPQPFDLSPDELLELKGEQVPNRVIDAMAGAPPLPPKPGEGKASAPHSPAPRGLPTEPGVYIVTANGNTKILGQVVTFDRTGSLFVSWVTIGIKARHGNVQLPGSHAQTIVDERPSFYFIPVKQQADAGVDAGDLVLIHLEQKPERRQFEISAAGDWRASSGISITHQVQLVRSEQAEGVYKITPIAGLPNGEYALYIRRGDGLSAYVYDFSSGGEQAR
ncbi:MAG: hypothetical protein WA655_02085 [Candidatus Korobacteraceae bacterium]